MSDIRNSHLLHSKDKDLALPSSVSRICKYVLTQTEQCQCLCISQIFCNYDRTVLHSEQRQQSFLHIFIFQRQFCSIYDGRISKSCYLLVPSELHDESVLHLRKFLLRLLLCIDDQILISCLFQSCYCIVDLIQISSAYAQNYACFCCQAFIAS